MLEAREDGRAQEDGEEEPGKGRGRVGGGGTGGRTRRGDEGSFEAGEISLLSRRAVSPGLVLRDGTRARR